MRRLLMACLLILSVCTLAEATITDVTGWWKFDDGSGSTPQDSSGGNSHGLLQVAGNWQAAGNCKAAPPTGLNGCLGFTSGQVGQYMSIPGTIEGFGNNNAFSVTLWFQATGTPVNASDIFGLPPIVQDGGLFMGLFWGRIGGGTEGLYAYNWDGTEDVTPVQAYTAGTWVHLGWVHGGGTLKLYVNGVLAQSVASGNTTDMTGALQLFKAETTAACTTICRVDDLRTFTRALTDSDMLEFMGTAPSTAFKRRSEWVD